MAKKKKIRRTPERRISFRIQIFEKDFDSFLEFTQNLTHPKTQEKYFSDDEIERTVTLLRNKELDSDDNPKDYLKKLNRAQQVFVIINAKKPNGESFFENGEVHLLKKHILLNKKFDSAFLIKRIEEAKKLYTRPHFEHNLKMAKSLQEDRSQNKATAEEVRIAELEKKLRTKDNSLRSLRNEFEKKEKKMKSNFEATELVYAKTIESLKSTISTLHKEKDNLEEKNASLKNNLQAEKRRNGELKKSLAKKRKKINFLDTFLGSPKQSAAQKKDKQLQEELSVAQNKISELEEENAKLRAAARNSSDSTSANPSIESIVNLAVREAVRPLEAQIRLLDKKVAGHQSFISKHFSQKIEKSEIDETQEPKDKQNILRSWGLNDTDIEILSQQKVLVVDHQEYRRRFENLWPNICDAEFFDIKNADAVFFENAINGDDYDFIVITRRRKHKINHRIIDGENKQSPKIIDRTLFDDANPRIIAEIVRRAKAQTQ